MTGRDELALEAGVPGAETALLTRLVVDPAGAPVDPAWMRGITVADRDRLLAAVYDACFGDEIESAAGCRSCRAALHLTLSLEALLRHQEVARPDGVRGPDALGWYEVVQAGRFRLPTIGDLDEAGVLPAAEADALLRERCCPGVPDAAIDRIQEAMDAVAPILDLDIQIRCPDCGDPQTVRFSLAAFLVSALTRERRFLTREVHRLAVTYGWRLEEILGLSREDRRTFVMLAEAESARSAPA